MKNFLSIATALCCMLLAIPFTAQATPLSDGAIIFVGTNKMTHEDVEGWEPTGVNKAITYDETNHVLTLNEVAFTAELDIDASAFWDADFTIRIEGTVQTTFEMQGKTAIRFRGGKGLIIEGEKGTGLSININNVGGNGGCCIMCATTFSTSMAQSDYLPLTIQGGVCVSANNYGANENKYAAVIAYPLTITSSDLRAATTKGTGIEAVQTSKGLNGISTTKSQWMNYDENDNYFWTWKAYAMTYDIWVNGYALTDTRHSLTTDDMTNITSGALNYDPETNVLELSGGFTLDSHDGYSNGIRYYGSQPLTIKVNSGTPVTISETSMSSSNAALNVDGPVIIDLNGCDLVLKSTNGIGLFIKNELTIINSMGVGSLNDAEQKKLTIDSPAGYGILGSGSNPQMTINRANVVAGGNSGSVVEIPTTLTNVKMEEAYHWDTNNSVVDESENVVADPMNPVHFNISAWKLKANSLSEGAAHFTLSAGEDTFEDEGLFTEGTEITITAEADGSFVFARWMDDSDWKDEILKMGETRTFTMPAKSQELTAMYYYEVSSSDEWYGVNDGKFISFRMDDHGAEVAKADEPIATNVKAGEFVDDIWYYLDNTTLKSLPFSGLSDGDKLEPDDDPIATGISSDVTDMAYDFSSGSIYAIAATKLLRVDFDEQKLVEIGNLEYKEAPASAVAIAIDVSGTIYLLSTGDGTEGVLYTVAEIDEDGKKVLLAVAGAEEKGGKIGVKVTNEAQSIAFDHSSGELFWGASDYIRTITMDDELKAWIVGDLGQKEGTQGVIKAMHKMDMEYCVKVRVADDQEEFGTVSVGKGSATSGYFMNGQTATIVAKPNEGYTFAYWTQKGKTKVISDNATYKFIVQSNVTYVANFEPTDEGLDHQQSEIKNHKLIKDGQLFIIRGDKTYTADGREVL